MRVWIFPLILGKGKKLFEQGTVPSNLKLIDSRISGSGVIITTYVPAGDVPIGCFGLQEPTELELERRKKVASE
ncbi:MAG TPA: hypothetical protein VFW11_22050 [Cyclobacteriaceae bacterium]|nr:hypothetical protein [Cyclobacteriaceae bacterium]